MSKDESSQPQPEPTPDVARRNFLTATSTLAMGGGLAAGYGCFGVYAGRYLFPSAGGDVAWQFVAVAKEMKLGESKEYIGPTGAKVVVARQGEGETAADFVALSSVCPHLGCQVHWEPQNDRFFCPCHNGVFDPQGAPVEGPPASANQHLVRFPLKVEEGLLYIEVPTTSIIQEG